MRILTLMLLLLASGLEAQQLKWEPGFFLGGGNYQGDLVETYGPFLPETNLAYGGSLRYNLGREWAFNLGVVSGQISGSDQNFSDPRFVASRNISFRSRLTETALRIEWEPFGNRRYPKEGGYKKLFSPFFFTGVAYSFLKNGTDYSNVPRTLILEQVALDKTAIKKNSHLAIPMGAGLKIDLSKYTVLYLQAGLRKAFTDLLDGVSESGNPDTEDWYSFGGITLSRRFGLPDYDRDGIVDRDDRCPRQAGVASAQGCPDADGDGVEDLEDVCPLAFGDKELNGCPDTDGDKVIDLLDKCPYTAGLEAFDGCPDTDEDGIIDSEDACPTVAGVAEEGGCPYPDSDADGIIDKEDACPDTPGVAEEGGCPYPDSDADGIIDKEDACPDLPGPADLGGCPDTDADGVIDPEDRCPNTPGLSEQEGCPEIEEEDKAVLKLAMETVRFETASARLKPASLAILDQVADVLAKYPDYGLRISGHTDNQGKDESNQDLSERRAQSCLQHLAGAGIDNDRMLHEGLGETRPIGDNATAEGRRLNRRVEFELFVQEKQVQQVEEIARTDEKADTVAVSQTGSASPPPAVMADSLLAVAPDLLPQSTETIAQGQVELAHQPSTIPSRPDSLQTIIQDTNESRPGPNRPGGEIMTGIEPGETPAADSLQTTAPETIAQTTAETNKSKPQTARPGGEELPGIEPGETPAADSLQTTAPERIAQTTAETNRSKPENARPGGEELPGIEPGETPAADSLQTTAPERIAQTTAETNRSKAENARPGSEELPDVSPGESTTADSLSRAKPGMIAQTPPAADTSITASPNNTDTVVAQPITPPARPENISAAEPAAAPSAPTVRPLQPRIFETPDTIYWFEPDENLLDGRSVRTMVDIELPETYLQPEPAADTARQAPALPATDDVLTPKEPLSPLGKKDGEQATKSTMEQRIEALERRIEALEEQIRRLEKLLINQSSTPRDSSQTNPSPVKKPKEGNG